MPAAFTSWEAVRQGRHPRPPPRRHSPGWKTGVIVAEGAATVSPCWVASRPAVAGKSRGLCGRGVRLDRWPRRAPLGKESLSIADSPAHVGGGP